MRKLILIFICLSSVSVMLSCGISSAATIQAVSCSKANVQSAINAAANGDTVVVPVGSCSWSGAVSLNNRNGITVICETAGGCNISFSGGAFAIDYTPTPITNLIRVSGFTFSGTPGTAAIWFLGTNDIEQVRIDHNTFSNLGQSRIAILFGAVDPGIVGRVWGVVDHNTFTGSGNFMGVKNLSGQNTAWTAGLSGSKYNLFLEDNTFTFTGAYDAGTGCMDAWNGGNTVFRHNTTNNCRVVSHGICHGGPPNFEIYNNTISTNDGYRLIHHQGSGEFIVFNNILNNDHIALLHYRSCPSVDTGCSYPRCDGTQSIDGNRLPLTTYYGYPCWKQPGRDVNGNLKPIYVWNNTVSQAKSDMRIENAWGCSNPGVETHLQASRDYYNAVSANAQTFPTTPFNGTSGMGFGTLANRPATCTTNSLESGGGVGYFATDVGPQGTLYRCSATNTWAVHYTPYTYPHPLTQTTSILYGDVSENGSITAYDASLAAQYAVGSITLTNTQITKADVSGNGSVTSYDASLIAQYAVGLITKFPVQG